MSDGASTTRDVAGAATIEKVTVVDAEPATDPVAVTVTVAVEIAVGVPLMTPVDDEMDSPEGSPVAEKVTVPLNRDGVIADVLVIATPTVPLTDNPVGEIEGPRYVNKVFAELACESEFDTTTLAVPPDPAGVSQLREVELATETPEHTPPPTVTVAPSRNPVPTIVMLVPPRVDPVAGLTEVTVGAAK